MAAKEKEMGDFKDLEIIGKYVVELHGSCDFILENYGIRKEARKAEMESLKNAKAEINGKKMAAKEKEMGDFKDLEIIGKYVVELHGSCDFILENYGIRKE